MTDQTDPTYKPICHDAWAIPPSPLMLKHGNDYHTCSSCGEPVKIVDLQNESKGQESMTDRTTLANRIWDLVPDSDAYKAIMQLVDAYAASRVLGVLDELEAESYVEEEPKGQNALRLRVVPMAAINNIRRRLKL